MYSFFKQKNACLVLESRHKRAHFLSPSLGVALSYRPSFCTDLHIDLSLSTLRLPARVLKLLAMIGRFCPGQDKINPESLSLHLSVTDSSEAGSGAYVTIAIMFS